MLLKERISWRIAPMITALLIVGCGGGDSGSNVGAMADLDGDGISDSRDVDDDNDGLIEVHNLQELDWMRNDLAGASLKAHIGNGDSTGCPVGGCNGYELVADLDFDTNGDGVMDANDAYFDYDGPGSGTGWLPVGSGGSPFRANFSGNGHTISNLYIDRGTSQDVGLFGVVDGTSNPVEIKNVHLDGALTKVTASSSLGLLAGLAQNNVLFSGNSVSGSVIGVNETGGLVGRAVSNITIRNSYATGNVDASGNVSGGLVGRANTGTADGAVMIQRSFAISAVTSTGSYVGGLVGISYKLDVDDTFATGSVSGVQYVGGLIGDANLQTNITKSFTVNSVTGSLSVGGFAGWSDTVTYESNYFSTTTPPSNGIGTVHAATGTEAAVSGRTTAQMQCPTRAADPACSPNMYFDWDSDTNGNDRVLWHYGNSSQLPGLILGGVVYRDGDADGVLD